MIPIWKCRHVELVARARLWWMHGRYREAAELFWLAAYVAPSTLHETAVLEAAWQATERSLGRVSELEVPQ